jgi:hypothetical protein
MRILKNTIRKSMLWFYIEVEQKKMNRRMKELQKEIDKNPELLNQEVSKENKLAVRVYLEKIIMYKNMLGVDCTLEKDTLNQVINN